MRVCLFLLLASFMSSLLFADNDLAGFQGKNRVLVLLASSADDPLLREQQAINAASAAGFGERDLIMVLEIRQDGPLHRKFGLQGRDFRALLIGKDGHTALQRSKPISATELFSVIDAMPMRRDEIRRQKKASASSHM